MTLETKIKLAFPNLTNNQIREITNLLTSKEIPDKYPRVLYYKNYFPHLNSSVKIIIAVSEVIGSRGLSVFDIEEKNIFHIRMGDPNTPTFIVIGHNILIKSLRQFIEDRDYKLKVTYAKSNTKRVQKKVL